MINTILGTKSHMSQAFTPSGRRVPVSVVKSGANIVTQVKTEEKDGYWAVQIGFGQKKIKNITKPLRGHLKKMENGKADHSSGMGKMENELPRYLKEVKISQEEKLETGQTINPQDVLKPGDLVAVTGVSKGKGFAGVVKRWGFAGGPKTHGQSDRHRAPGSIGQGTTPGRVFKGKKMAGRMGTAGTTVKNLTVLDIDEDKGEIILSGPVPGPRNSLLLIKKIGEKKNFEDTEGEEEQDAAKETDK